MLHILAEKCFLSIQGEGVRAGCPSIFIRYAGCNLRCQFGLKCSNNSNSRVVPEHIQQVIDNLDNYTRVQDLPVFPNYCDTYIGILPEFRRFWTTYNSTEELVNDVTDLVVNNENYQDFSSIDLVFTGGEPMLHQKQIIDLLHNLYVYGFRNITFETNGTIKLDESLKEDWKHIALKYNITFSISPKISSANYTIDETCVPSALESYNALIKECNKMKHHIMLKYVVQDESDIKMIQEFNDRYHKAGVQEDTICLMPCGGKSDPSFKQKCQLVAELCIKYGFRYSPRLQNDIWDNSWAK